MSFTIMAEYKFTYEIILPFLAFTELPNVRRVNCQMETTLVSGKVWHACAKNALSNFEFCCEHFEQPQLRRFIALVLALIKAVPTEGPQVPFHGKAHVQKLCKTLDSAKQLAASQRLMEGGMANSFIAHVRFPGENMIAALNKEQVKMSFAMPVTFPGALGADYLHIHFAFRGGIFYVAARNDGLHADSIPMHQTTHGQFRSLIAMGLVSVDPNLLMDFRGLSMLLNGPWEPALFGMLSLTKGKPAAAKALAHGVLCVFCVRNSAPKESTCMANFLNLEEK